jgi:PAS domain-containing protein
MRRFVAKIDNVTKVLNAVASGIVIQEPEGGLVFVNEAAARIFMCDSPEAAMKKGAKGIFADFDYFDERGDPIPPERIPGRQALLGVDEPNQLIGYSKHKNTKKIRWTSVRALPIKDDDGKTILAVTVMEDITNLKSTERHLKEANARITKLLTQTLSPQPRSRRLRLPE